MVSVVVVRVLSVYDMMVVWCLGVVCFGLSVVVIGLVYMRMIGW